MSKLGSFRDARRPVSGTYAETVTVPAGTTLSVGALSAGARDRVAAPDTASGRDQQAYTGGNRFAPEGLTQPAPCLCPPCRSTPTA
ncbi:hypothetical protein E5S69_28035 [Cupriavidus necator]|nr:hypothetical protein [Cupriavidus necator]